MNCLSQLIRVRSVLICVAVVLFMALSTLKCFAEGIRFAISDQAENSMPCRVHLIDSANKAVKPNGVVAWDDHFVIDGEETVGVAPGKYRWTIERGPEYAPVSGEVEVPTDATSAVTQTLNRISNLREEGWFSADLHVHRTVADIEPLMKAEDLDFVPVIEWWNRPAKDSRPLERTTTRFDGRRIYQRMAGEDEREGGALLYFDLNQPLDLTVQSREVPSPMQFVETARERNKDVWIDIEKPFWWDVPTWLATEKMDSIGIANNHMNRSQMYLSEAWGKPRDVKRLPNPKGNGFWTQEIYYKILDSGLRIPPSAGSASGVLKNPVGYNRVYVQLTDEEFTRDNWFAALKSGRCFVTNGPLLRTRANETWPGETLRLTDGSLQIKLAIELSSNDPISDVEVIYNGQVVKHIEVGTETTQQLTAEIQVDEPGWMLLRTLADVDHTFRFASTAPWYIEKPDGKRRISRSATQFFLDWVNERIERVNQNTDADQREPVMRWHVGAREFWIRRREMATH